MNKDRIIGKWEQLKGESLKQWGRLTNDQIDQINGDRIRLIGTIRETYGITKEEAENQVERFLADCERRENV